MANRRDDGHDEDMPNYGLNACIAHAYLTIQKERDQEKQDEDRDDKDDKKK
jgi:hypothetical protein